MGQVIKCIKKDRRLASRLRWNSQRELTRSARWILWKKTEVQGRKEEGDGKATEKESWW